MDSSQSAITPQREKILWGILLLILGIWACFSYTNWISDSEFWPVTLAGHWEEWRGNPALIYKAVFHGTLSWIYAFDLNSVEHLKVAKAFYSLLGVLSFVLFFKIAKTRLDSVRAFLLTMLFLFSNLGFSQIGVIRSDFLSFLFFEIALLVVIAQPTESWKRVGWWNLFFAVLIFLTTPKSVYFVILLAVFSLVRVNRDARFKLFNLFLMIACVGVFMIYVISSTNEAFLSALRFAIESQRSRDSFWHTTSPIYLKNDLHIVTMIATFWVYQLIEIVRGRLPKKDIAWLFLGAISLALINLHKPVLPFFMGALWGVFFLSILPVVNYLKIKYLAAVFTLSLSIFLLRFSPNYHYSNSVQYDAIGALDDSIRKLPGEKLFDGLGAIPRAPQLVSYLGPLDRIANTGIFIQMVEQKPAIVINTHRMLLIEADVNSFLIKNYRSIGFGYWLRKDIESRIDLNNIKSALHVFGYYPIPEILELEHSGAK